MSNPTFDIDCYGAPYVTTHKRRAITAPRDSIAKRSRQVNQRKIRTFTLTLGAETPTVILDRISELWALAGRVVALNFTPLGESATEVRFATPWKYARQSAVHGTATVELEELL